MAARVSSAAHGGQILITRAWYELVEKDLKTMMLPDETEPLIVIPHGMSLLKGLLEEVEILEIVPASLSKRRFPPINTLTNRGHDATHIDMPGMSDTPVEPDNKT